MFPVGLQELELWDDIIETLVILEKPKRAERLLRARLNMMPGPGSAKLWCLLGTVTNDDEAFNKVTQRQSEHCVAAEVKFLPFSLSLCLSANTPRPGK